MILPLHSKISIHRIAPSDALLVLGLIGICSYVTLHWWRGAYSLGADGETYLEIATHFRSSWQYLPLKYDSYWPPGWPLILAMLSALFGDAHYGLHIWNTALLFGTVLFLRQALRRIDYGMSVLAPLFLIYSMQAANNVLFAQYELTNFFMVTAGLYLLYLGRFSLAGICILITVFLQPKILFFWPIATFGAWHSNFPRHPKRGLVALFGPVLIAMLLWGCRNYFILGQFAPVSTNGGINFYIGNNPLATGGYFLPEDAPSWPTVPYSNSSFYVRQGLAFAFSHPVRTVQLWGQKGVRFWAIRAPEDYWLFLGLFLCALRKSCRRSVKNNSFLCAQAYWLGYVMAIHVITFADARFRFGVQPAICVLASVGYLPRFRLHDETDPLDSS